MKYAYVILLSLIWAAPSFAQHSHGSQKGPNGGQMEDIAGVEAELVISGNTITINVFDESKKPVATKGFTGAALVAATAGRETITLAPSGENSLKGETKNVIAADTAITLTIKTAEGKSGQAKFKK